MMQVLEKSRASNRNCSASSYVPVRALPPIYPKLFTGAAEGTSFSKTRIVLKEYSGTHTRPKLLHATEA